MSNGDNGVMSNGYVFGASNPPPPPKKKGGWDMNKLVIMVHSKNNIPPIDPFFSTYPIQGVGKRLEPVPGGAGSDGGFKPRSLLL